MIRLFLDQALPLRGEKSLRDRRWDAIHAATAGLATAPDRAILDWCAEREYTVATHDHGFHQLIVLAQAAGPSVIRIRLQGLSYEEIAALIDRVSRSHAAAIESGALVSVTGRRVKVRTLPLRGRTE